MKSGGEERGYGYQSDQAEVKTRMETVQTRDNPEDGRIKDDPERQSRGGGYSGGGGKRRQRDEDEDRPAIDLLRGHNIDISL